MFKAIFRVISFALMIGPVPTMAQQYTYSSGEVWAVTQDLPSGPVTETGPKPTCNLSTQIWDDKGLDIQYVLINRDFVEPWARVHSDSWKLPVGRSTDITLDMAGGVVPVSVTATTATDLAGPIQRERQNSDNYFILELSIQTMLNPKVRGVGFRVRFAGNEPAWPVSAPDRYEAYQVKTALNKCIADLRRKAATFYPADGRGASDGPTSPFAADPSAARQTTSEPNQAGESAPATSTAKGSWNFAKEIEEMTTFCFASVDKDDIAVGFIGQPGGKFSGYVSGVFTKDTRSVWTVDGIHSETSTGTFDSYFEWYDFHELTADFLNRVGAGKELKISEFGGNGTTVSLDGADAAISSLKLCLAEPQTGAPVE